MTRLGQSQGQGSFLLCKKVAFTGLEAPSPLAPSLQCLWPVPHPASKQVQRALAQLLRSCGAKGPAGLVWKAGLDEPLFEGGPFQLNPV